MSELSPYWKRTRRITAWLLLIWVLLTFGVNWFARELNAFTMLGFPFGFYLGAQGALFCYLAIIVYYNRKMRDLDAEYGVDEDLPGA